MKEFGKMRARIPWTHMIAKTIAHGERWLRGRGSCRHSSHVDTKLLKRAFNLMREMEDFNSDYQKWISQNERFKLKNYLLSSSESFAWHTNRIVVLLFKCCGKLVWNPHEVEFACLASIKCIWRWTKPRKGIDKKILVNQQERCVW